MYLFLHLMILYLSMIDCNIFEVYVGLSAYDCQQEIFVVSEILEELGT